jgi:AcrR family transcriptional regulator
MTHGEAPCARDQEPRLTPPTRARRAAPRRTEPVRRATPLARLLDAPAPPPRVTPLAVFELARHKWLAGERLDIGRLAEELGVARATVFRWVGSRELLYGEVISSLFAAALDKARREARGTGAEHVADMTHRLLAFLLAAEPLRRFVEQDAEFALRVLTSRSSPVERRCAAAVRELLEEGIAAGTITPAMPVDALAYTIVRIAEAFLYRDVITGESPDIETATTAIRILVAATPESAGEPRPRARAGKPRRHG